MRRLLKVDINLGKTLPNEIFQYPVRCRRDQAQLQPRAAENLDVLPHLHQNDLNHHQSPTLYLQTSQEHELFLLTHRWLSDVNNRKSIVMVSLNLAVKEFVKFKELMEASLPDRASTKHLAGRNLDRMEPTPSLRYQKAAWCMIFCRVNVKNWKNELKEFKL